MGRGSIGLLNASIALSLASSLLAATTDAQALDYIFTKIADTNGRFSAFGVGAAVNSSGTVVFKGELDSGGEGVFTGEGGSITTIVDSDGPFAHFTDRPTINSSGDVAFVASLDSQDTAVFASSGGTLKLIADTKGEFLIFGPWSLIDDGGNVVFRALLDSGGVGLFVSNGGSATKIAGDDTSPSSGGFNTPSISRSGSVTFLHRGPNGFSAIFAWHSGDLRLVNDAFDTQFQGHLSPSINDGGEVAFKATLDGGGEGAFTTTGSNVVVVADTDDPFSWFSTVTINNSGAVVFGAKLVVGGVGIFTGPNPVTDKVILSGDILDGSIVDTVNLSRAGFGDSGQVAFRAALVDGRTGVFRADPDTDKDGVADIADGCPNDPAKVESGPCGCGNGETTLDGDAREPPPAGQPTDACGCDGGMGGMMVMPMTLLGIGLMRRRRRMRR